MNNNTARPEMWKRAINAQADAEIAELKAHAAEKRAAMGKEKSERAAKEAISEMTSERSRVEFRFKRDISKCDYDMKKSVLAHRNELIEGFFKDIAREIQDFSKTPEYTAYITRALERAHAELGDGADVVIIARPLDVDKVKPLTDYPVEEDASITLGGICARRGSLYADFTFDRALENEKAAFSEKSELRL